MSNGPRPAPALPGGAEPRDRALWVLVGCLVCQMGLGCGYVFGAVLKNIVAEFEWSRAAFGAASSGLLLAMGVSAPFVGRLTETLGARRVLSGATLLLGLSLWLFGRIEGLWQFFATCALLGVALTGLGDIPVGALATRWFARRRGLALAAIYTGSNLGGALVPIAATAVAAETSWRLAVQALGVVAVVVILPFAAWVVREPGGRGLEEVASPVGPPERGPSAGAGAGGRDLTLGEALRTRSFWILAFVLVSFYFYYLAVNQHLIPFLSDIGYSDARAAASLGGAVGLGVVSKLAIGVLADRIAKKTALLLNFAVLAGGSVLLLFADSPALLLVFLAAHGFATAAENVVLPLVVVECFGVRHMASIYGALMLSLFPGGALGPIFAGAVFDALGDYRVAFGTFAALNLGGLAALAAVRREA